MVAQFAIFVCAYFKLNWPVFLEYLTPWIKKCYVNYVAEDTICNVDVNFQREVIINIIHKNVPNLKLR
jgi:hypothetical protein